MPRLPSIAVLIALNALPVYGVFNWGWQSFDLIFLYWLENLVIGAFTLLRLLLRPYRHFIDYALVFFVAPFFTFHYGIFCLGHGSFVFSLFGPEDLEASGFFGALELVWPTLQSKNLLLAAIGLLLLQVFDWFRDLRRHGLGFDGVRQLMLAPYRRIIILHVAILASGFALAALDEPVAGLIILVLVKTAFDIHHWIGDEEREDVDADTRGHRRGLPREKLQAMLEQFAEPEIEVNGKKVRFDSFRQMKDSRQLRMLASIMRLFGRSGDFRQIEEFLDMKIAEENGERPFDRDG